MYPDYFNYRKSNALPEKQMAQIKLTLLFFNILGLMTYATVLVIDWDTWKSIILFIVGLAFAIIKLVTGVMDMFRKYYDFMDFFGNRKTDKQVKKKEAEDRLKNSL